MVLLAVFSRVFILVMTMTRLRALEGTVLPGPFVVDMEGCTVLTELYVGCCVPLCVLDAAVYLGSSSPSRIFVYVSQNTLQFAFSGVERSPQQLPSSSANVAAAMAQNALMANSGASSEVR